MVITITSFAIDLTHHFPIQSTSSIDSIEALPFANDNAGTIKQRAGTMHQPHTLHSHRTDPHQTFASHPGGGSGITCSNSSGGGVGGSNQLQQQPSLSSSSSSSSASLATTVTVAAHAAIGSGGGVGGYPHHLSATTTPSPTLSGASSSMGAIGDHPPTSIIGSQPADTDVTGMAEAAGAVTASSTNASATALDSANVLNDIGNMLANLTDELDAMLEEEKRAGLNDSE